MGLCHLWLLERGPPLGDQELPTEGFELAFANWLGLTFLGLSLLILKWRPKSSTMGLGEWDGTIGGPCLGVCILEKSK